MARNGTKTGGGTRKGRPNKLTVRTRDALLAYVEQAAQDDPMAHPVRLLTAIMTSPTTSTAERLTAAMALLDRMLPKLRSVDATVQAQVATTYTVTLWNYHDAEEALRHAGTGAPSSGNGHPAEALNVEPQHYGGTV